MAKEWLFHFLQHLGRDRAAGATSWRWQPFWTWSCLPTQTPLLATSGKAHRHLHTSTQASVTASNNLRPVFVC